jgi:hypothetical protein
MILLRLLQRYRLLNFPLTNSSLREGWSLADTLSLPFRDAFLLLRTSGLGVANVDLENRASDPEFIPVAQLITLPGPGGNVWRNFPGGLRLNPHAVHVGAVPTPAVPHLDLGRVHVEQAMMAGNGQELYLVGQLDVTVGSPAHHAQGRLLEHVFRPIELPTLDCQCHLGRHTEPPFYQTALPHPFPKTGLSVHFLAGRWD